MGRCQPRRIIDPRLRQIQRPVDKGVAVARYIGGKDADLAVGDFTRRTRILASHTAGCLALFQKTGLVDDQYRICSTEMLDHIVAHNVA